MPKMHDEIVRHWVQHAEAHLPCSSSKVLVYTTISDFSEDLKSPSVYQFELDDESKRPILPLLDLADPNLALGQISEVLTRYLAALWGT